MAANIKNTFFIKMNMKNIILDFSFLLVKKSLRICIFINIKY